MILRMLLSLVASCCMVFTLVVTPAHGFQVAPLTNVRVLDITRHSQQLLHQHHLVLHQYRRSPVSPSILTLAAEAEDGSGGALDTIAIDPATKTELRSIANYISKQTVESLLSPSEARAITNELFFDNKSQSTIFNDKSYEQYVKYWNKVENRLREENQRTPADLLGRELTERILSSIRGDPIKGQKGSGGKGSSYDKQTVLTFLESDAINALFSQLLYDAIFEFTIKIDIIGNAISNLPLLGPVRNQVLKESKRNMDRTLGPLLQRFLSGYTRVAIRQAVDFVVSEENSSSFGKANARLVSYLLEKRTVADWVPEEKTMGEWREEAWSYLVGLETDGDGENGGKVKEDQKKVVEQGIDWVYDLVGDKCVEDGGVNVNEILDASPTLERSLGTFWERCQEASKAN